MKILIYLNKLLYYYIMSKNFYVYLLKSTKGTTYVGATVNLERRLRQHNKELVGGAKATTAKVKKGESWK